MKIGRILMLVVGALFALSALGLLAGAAGLAWANNIQRDGGYLTSPLERFTVDAPALTTSGPGHGGPNEMVEDQIPAGFPAGDLASVMVRGSAVDPGAEIFLGIADRTDVASYLAGVRHRELTDVDYDPFRPEYREVAGTATPDPPAGQGFWVASAAGSGTQELTWAATPGDWTVVVMRADGGVLKAADVQAGVRSDLLGPLAVGLLTGGIVLLLLGAGLIVAGAIGLGRQAQAERGPVELGPVERQGVGPRDGAQGHVGPASAAQGLARAAAHGPGPAGWGHGVPTAPPPAGGPSPASDDYRPYPVRLTGHLDPGLSRWMWLVKWFLAIPHLFVLLLLGIAMFVTSIVAWFAILFTGRYPRSLFEFNVGVMRWHWRVAFYAFSVVGTDRYPPFTLARTDYPADLEVEYPERLHRGLVLVKSWLLAIPQLLVVAALTGGTLFASGEWDGDRGGGQAAAGGSAGWASWEAERQPGISLLAVLVLVAAVILLFTGRYRRPLFDLIMGLNRWIVRVGAYVWLMRDEYPPFRLDAGPIEPAEGSAPPDFWPDATPGPPVGDGSVPDDLPRQTPPEIRPSGPPMPPPTGGSTPGGGTGA
jgi:hypothetical protein